MHPIDFKEANKVFANDQPEYLPLPVFHNYHSKQGEVISCWKLTWRERLRILFRGRIYSCLLSFNQPLTPQSLYTSKWEVLDKKFFTKELYDIIKNERENQNQLACDSGAKA